MIQEELKLFMVLLGSKAPGRIVEQHDFFFGIGTDLKSLLAEMHNFWPEAGKSLHIDGWREVTAVEGYQVTVVPADQQQKTGKRLFFINLGGYQEGKLEEQHYTLLTVQDDRKSAVKTSTLTDFFRQQSIKSIRSAAAHIDEKYGIDVDDIYRIEDVLPEHVKQQYSIEVRPNASAVPDQIHLGYYKLDQV
jgi:hypothetical protein